MEGNKKGLRTKPAKKALGNFLDLFFLQPSNPPNQGHVAEACHASRIFVRKLFFGEFFRTVFCIFQVQFPRRAGRKEGRKVEGGRRKGREGGREEGRKGGSKRGSKEARKQGSKQASKQARKEGRKEQFFAGGALRPPPHPPPAFPI